MMTPFPWAPPKRDRSLITQSRMRRAAVWTRAVVALLVLPAIAHAQDGRTKLDTTFAFDKTGAVELDVTAGSIHITTWDKPSVHVVVGVTGGGEFDFDGNHSRLTLSGYARHNAKQWGVQCTLMVPTGARLRLSTVAAPISVTGVSGSISASSVSGLIDLADVSGNIDIDNVSGKIHVAGAPGEVHVSGVSSDIVIEGASGAVDVESVSGTVHMNKIRSSRVNVTNVSGSVAYDGWLDPQGLYDMESHSGWIALSVPPKSNAWVNVETFKGTVRNNYPDAVRRTEDPDDADTNYHYTLGKGGAKVRLETFSGQIQITSR